MSCRVLDPLLNDLMSPSIRRLPTTLNLNGREISAAEYERPIDQHQIRYFLDCLLSVARFGGQGFVKVLRATQIKRTPYAPLVTRAEQGELVSSTKLINGLT